MSAQPQPLLQDHPMNPGTRSMILRRDLVWITVLCVIGMLTTIVFVSAPELDLKVSGLFADVEAGRFPLAKHPVAEFFNDLIEYLALGMALLAIGGLIYTLPKPRAWMGMGRRHFGFLFFSMLLGPALIANVLFKDQWGRARPREVSQFGGEATFSPPMVITDQCARNCSFVSGDAAMGFTMLALALMLPLAAAVRAKAVVAALLFGAFIGGVRIVQGAHFLSDVIFSGVFMSLTIITLKMLILDGVWGIREKSWREMTVAADDVHMASALVWAPTEPALTSRFAALLGRLGLVHDGEAAAWREDWQGARARKGSGRWPWFLLRSRPEDFGLPPARTGEQSSPEAENDGTSGNGSRG